MPATRRPQKMLDRLVDTLTFDPLAFSRMAPGGEAGRAPRVCERRGLRHGGSCRPWRIPAATRREPHGEGLSDSDGGDSGPRRGE